MPANAKDADVRGRAPRRVAWIVLAHLAFVVVSISSRFSLFHGSLGKLALTYGNACGAFRDYTFFAPSVASGTRAAFLVEDADRTRHLVAFDTPTRELGFRYNSIIRSGMQNEVARDLFAQSWAALVLGNRPEARKVTVMVEWMFTPSMAEFARGRRPEWQPLYVGEFSLRRSPVEGLSE